MEKQQYLSEIEIFHNNEKVFTDTFSSVWRMLAE